MAESNLTKSSLTIKLHRIITNINTYTISGFNNINFIRPTYSKIENLGYDINVDSISVFLLLHFDF